jgi:competence protein ComEA
VARGLERERRAARPLAEGETVDPNRADEAELRRLPGIGPVTARAVIRHRRQHGPFRSREELLDVPGVGPRTMARLADRIPLPPGTATEAGKGRRLNLNRATADELRSLPGIGPALAEAILRSRRRDGPFRRPEDLSRVPGIGPARLEAVRDLVRAGPP